MVLQLLKDQVQVPSIYLFFLPRSPSVTAVQNGQLLCGVSNMHGGSVHPPKLFVDPPPVAQIGPVAEDADLGSCGADPAIFIQLHPSGRYPLCLGRFQLS